MRNLLFILCCLLSLSVVGQDDLNYDGNNDGCVNYEDVLNILTEYGQCEDSSIFECGDDIEHENYEYSTVQIGEQCWFSENCRYLPVVFPSSASSTIDPYYYVYGYEGSTVSTAQATNNYATFGALYNWPAVREPGICPSGWHIPSDGEWQTMEMALGMSASEASSIGWRGTDQGSQMKSTSGWNEDFGDGSNSSGFTGLPGGERMSAGFNGYGYYGKWWSASEPDYNSYSWRRNLSYSWNLVSRNIEPQSFGYPARCVRD